jgi:hypothetical protein
MRERLTNCKQPKPLKRNPLTNTRKARARPKILTFMRKTMITRKSLRRKKRLLLLNSRESRTKMLRLKGYVTNKRKLTDSKLNKKKPTKSNSRLKKLSQRESKRKS